MGGWYVCVELSLLGSNNFHCANHIQLDPPTFLTTQGRGGERRRKWQVSTDSFHCPFEEDEEYGANLLLLFFLQLM